MTGQLELVYAPATTGRQTWERELDALREAVTLLTAKEVCFELNVGRTLLADAMAERDRKHWQAEWTHVVIAMLVRRADEGALDLARRIIAARAISAPFVVEDSNDDITPEAIAAAELIIARAKRRGKKSR